MFEYEASGLGVADVELELVADARRAVDGDPGAKVVAGAERVRAEAYHFAGPRDEVRHRTGFLAAQSYEEFAVDLRLLGRRRRVPRVVYGREWRLPVQTGNDGAAARYGRNPGGFADRMRESHGAQDACAVQEGPHGMTPPCCPTCQINCVTMYRTCTHLVC